MATCSLHEMKNRLGMPCPICTNITLRAELEDAKARTRIEKELRSQAEEEKVWLEAVLVAVAALHDEYDGPHTYCHECGGLTPCETRRAVHGGK